MERLFHNANELEQEIILLNLINYADSDINDNSIDILPLMEFQLIILLIILLIKLLSKFSINII